MPQPDENRPSYPGFEGTEGAPPLADEETLPFVDLYKRSDTVGSGAYAPDANQWDSNPYGPRDQYPPQPYANPPYEPYANSPYQQFEPKPQHYTMAPSSQQHHQYGYYSHAPVEHPQSTTVLVLALLGLMQPITPFIAWYIGSRARAEIRRGAPYAYTGSLKAGHITAKVLSILTLVGAAGYTAIVVLVLMAAMLF